MKRRHPSKFVHAMKMLRRNLRSYGMLSVTIVLSFSILLGYLAFVDSDLYNRYKRIFASPRNVVMVYGTNATVSIQAMEEMVERNAPGTQSYRYLQTAATLTQYGHNVNTQLTFLPSGNRPVFDQAISDEFTWPEEVHTLYGRETFQLQGNEAIVNEDFYLALGGDGTFPLPVNVPITWTDGTTSVLQLEIVGVCPDSAYEGGRLHLDESGDVAGYPVIYLSQTMLGSRTAQDLDGVRTTAIFCTDAPQTVCSCADQFKGSLVCLAASKAQDSATETIRIQKQTKAAIAIILLALLGTNLYSSFTNALEGRKFEIGVKRAIGARSGAIVGQFLLESLAVMAGNILLSVLVVTDALCLYKLYQYFVLGEQWIIAVSAYSGAMFLVCSAALTLVFSLFFAYQSTQVEIVQYLKAE